MSHPVALASRGRARWLAVISLLAGLLSTTSAVADAPSPSDPRARELHALSDKILPKPGPTRSSEGLRELRGTLERLAAQLEATQSDPSVAQLQELRKRLRAARSAFALVRGRLASAGGASLVTDLEGQFSPLWEDVDSALASPNRRHERIASALARVEAAVAHRGDRRASGVTVLPLGGWK